MPVQDIPFDVRASFFLSLKKEAGVVDVIQKYPRLAAGVAAGAVGGSSVYARFRRGAGSSAHDADVAAEEARARVLGKKPESRPLSEWASKHPALAALLAGAGLGATAATSAGRTLTRHFGKAKHSAVDIALFERRSGLKPGVLTLYEKVSGVAPSDVMVDKKQLAAFGAWLQSSSSSAPKQSSSGFALKEAAAAQAVPKPQKPKGVATSKLRKLVQTPTFKQAVKIDGVKAPSMPSKDVKPPSLEVPGA